MSDETQTSPISAGGVEGTPSGDGFSAGQEGTFSSTAQEQTVSSAAGFAAEHPELIVAAAFAAGFVVARILKRLAR